jgi:hypothetical protein
MTRQRKGSTSTASAGTPKVTSENGKELNRNHGPALDPSEAARFLTALDPAATFFTFQTFDDDRDRKSKNLVRILHGTLKKHWDELARLNEMGAGIFVTVNETDGKGRSGDNIVRVRYLFLDLDGAPLEPVLADGRTPHIVIESSASRWHTYWRVADVPLDQFKKLQKSLIEQFGGDKAIHDLPRVMRLPGFMHRKGEPFLSHIVSTSDELPPYTIADFPQVEKKKAVTKRKPRARQDHTKWQKLNSAALANLEAWVPELFPEARTYQDGYRVTSASLGRDLEEDLSLMPQGIKDFGVHDLGDEKEGRRTPIDVVMEWGGKTLVEAAIWLRTQLGVPQEEELNWRECTAKGYPQASLHNARLAVDALGVECRYDLFHDKILIGYSGDKVQHEVRELAGEFTDNGLMRLRQIASDRFGFDLTTPHIHDAVRTLALEHCFDPVLDLLEGAQGAWDKTPRLDKWVVVYLGCRDKPLNCAIGRKHLIAAARRARAPGYKYDNITVLESREGEGKSTAVRILAGDENFSDQRLLGLNDREVQEQLSGVWMHENADLAGMKRAEVEQIKALLSRQADRARPAYGRVREDRKRRSIEWGTTNNKEYLQSQTGNRRFWPLETGKIDLEALRRDRLQLLGEAATYEAAGESIVLDGKLWPAAMAAQEARRAKDPWEDILVDIPPTIPTWRRKKNQDEDGSSEPDGEITIIYRDAGQERVSSRDLLEHVLKLSANRLGRFDTMRLSDVMSVLGWKRTPNGKVRIEGAQVRGYWRKEVM